MQGNNEVRNNRQEFSHSAAITVPVQKQPWRWAALCGAVQDALSSSWLPRGWLKAMTTVKSFLWPCVFFRREGVGLTIAKSRWHRKSGYTAPRVSFLPICFPCPGSQKGKPGSFLGEEDSADKVVGTGCWRAHTFGCPRAGRDGARVGVAERMAPRRDVHK